MKFEVKRSWMPLAAIGLLAVALAGAVHGADSDDSDQDKERYCRPLHGTGGSTEPAVCTVTVVKDDVACGGAGGGHRVTAASCTKQVTTYPDDACDGEEGECEPPSTNPSGLKSVSASANPSLAVGACVGSGDPDCSCKLNGETTYAKGRKTCGGV